MTRLLAVTASDVWPPPPPSPSRTSADVPTVFPGVTVTSIPMMRQWGAESAVRSAPPLLAVWRTGKFAVAAWDAVIREPGAGRAVEPPVACGRRVGHLPLVRPRPGGVTCPPKVVVL